MLPLILISDNKRATNTYLKEYIRENKFPASAIFSIHKDPRVISIEQIRELYPLFERSSIDRMLIVIHDFETAKIETQNAMLKILEEKAEKAQFILVSSVYGSLASTVLSRCIVKKLKSISKINVFPDFSKDLVSLMSTYTIEKKNENDGVSFCDNALSYIREKWSYGQADLRDGILSPQIAREILRTRIALSRNNLNPQIAIDHLLMLMSTNS